MSVVLTAWTLTLYGASDATGLVRMNWSSSYDGPDAHVYEAWRCTKESLNDCGPQSSDNWERLSTFAIEEDTVSVLNVYPSTGDASKVKVKFTFRDGTVKTNMHKSAALKVWMEGGIMQEGTNITTFDAAGRNPDTNEPLIFVTLVSGDDFEKNPNIIMNYDVAVFGTWDANGRVVRCSNSSGRILNQPSTNAVNVISNFIDQGLGVIAGHDTISGSYNTDIGLGKIPEKFGIQVIGDYSDAAGTCRVIDTEKVGYCQYRSTQIDVIKLGLITDFPWNIYGQRLTIPVSHTWNNIAHGHIWIELANGTYLNDSKLGNSSNKCKNYAERGRYFLTTYKNTAMIQTGHSNAESTDAERKVIANTIYYLKQRTQRNWSYDMSARDYSPPTAPTCKVNYEGDLEFTCSSSDELVTYWYKVIERNKVDYRDSVESNTIKVIQGGLKSFTYWIEGFDGTNTTQAPVDNQVKFSFDLPEMQEAFLNIYATDITGNNSPVTRFRFQNIFTDEWKDYNTDRTFASTLFAVVPLILMQL